MSPRPSEKFDWAAATLAGEMAANPLVRAVNFHSTSRVRTAEYRAQLAQLGGNFTPVTVCAFVG